MEGVDIKNLYNPAGKTIPTNFTIADLLTKGGVNLLNLVFVLAGLFFFANLVLAGWDFMMSSGDPKKISAATTRIINGVIGIVMTLTAFIVVRLVTTMLGLGSLV